MISVSDALAIIDAQSNVLEKVRTPLYQAFGSILASDVFSPIDMPPFRQSAMDGYAVKLSGNKYQLVGEMKAGDPHQIPLHAGEAVRVFTGAPVPVEADTVVIQEHVTRQENLITLQKEPTRFSNIRPKGEQVKKGINVLKKGTFLNEAAIGFLAGLGLTEIEVVKKPKVTIVTTGNELQEPGKKLKPGQIYESNGVMLQLALQRIGIHTTQIVKVEDDFDSTYRVIDDALKGTDVVLISGGISVGDYDFVKDALAKNKVKEFFYKINQKPGKPFWFGKKSNKTIFALPGNPASSLTCFYVYVLPALKKMMGHTAPHLKKLTALSTAVIQNPAKKTLFLKASVSNNQITPLTGQASSMLNTYAISNALCIVPEETEAIDKGEEVTYLDLNF